MLEDTIADIVGKLREGAFPNEQSVSQGIVLRVLSELHWDVFEPSVVWPEYATAGGGRADFALCEPRSKPKVLIDVRQRGKAEDGVGQLLRCAFRSDVPFVVLTDGRTWSFYLSAEFGDHERVRVYWLDLFEHSVERSAHVLEDCLGWRSVASGNALEASRREFRRQARRALARRAISDVWKQLVEQRDELLIELVREAVESKVGIRPDDEDVALFLAGRGESLTTQAVGSRPTRSKHVVTTDDAEAEARTKPSERGATRHLHQGEVVFFGVPFVYRNAKQRLVIVLRELANRDPTFLSRCSQNSNFSGSRRRYIGRKAAELYPGRPDLQSDHIEKLPGGWWLGTNLSNRQKDALVRAALEVAGLKSGVDVVFR